MKIQLKQIMADKGVTSVALAGKIGVSKVTISNLINNKTAPSLDTLEKIATALDVPMWQLFASPEEVQHKPTGNMVNITCPKCGEVIEVELKAKEK